MGLTTSTPIGRTAGCAGLAAILSGLLPSLARADDTNGLALDLSVKVISWLTTHANGILTTAYERAPVLVAVLAALLILPLTALAVLLAQSLYLKIQRPTRLRELPAPPEPERVAGWLKHADGIRTPLPASQPLVRLGRHEDNDIRLAIPTVHRHHAVIHRTPAAGYRITDVSGAAGNGVVVNGARCRETELHSGDTIQLGDAVLTFESALPAYLAAVSSTPVSQPTSNPG